MQLNVRLDLFFILTDSRPSSAWMKAAPCFATVVRVAEPSRTILPHSDDSASREAPVVVRSGGISENPHRFVSRRRFSFLAAEASLKNQTLRENQAIGILGHKKLIFVKCSYALSITKLLFTRRASGPRLPETKRPQHYSEK